MVAVTATFHTEVSGRCSTDSATMQTLLDALHRSLARDALRAELAGVYGDLDVLLGEYARPTANEARDIAKTYRTRTFQLTRLIWATPHLVWLTRSEAMEQLTCLSGKEPPADRPYRHALRLAMAISEIVDLMGDDAP